MLKFEGPKGPNMKKLLPNLIAALFLVICGTSLKAQTIDSVVTLLPKWKKGDVHTLKIKVNTTDEVKGASKKFASNFTAIFKITDVTDDEYITEWTYTEATVAPTDPLADNHIIAALKNTDIKMAFSKRGTFKYIINMDDVKTKTLASLNKLKAVYTGNQAMSVQLDLAKTMLSSDRGTEIVLKQVRIYFIGYGGSYVKGQVVKNNAYMPNGFGDRPFNATETVQITNFDDNLKLCTIESSKTVDGKAIRDAIVTYFKKISTPADYAAIDKEIGMASLDFSEKTRQQYQIKEGIINRSSFTRAMKLGIENRTTVWEFDVIN